MTTKSGVVRNLLSEEVKWPARRARAVYRGKKTTRSCRSIRPGIMSFALWRRYRAVHFELISILIESFIVGTGFFLQITLWLQQCDAWCDPHISPVWEIRYVNVTMYRTLSSSLSVAWLALPGEEHSARKEMMYTDTCEQAKWSLTSDKTFIHPTLCRRINWQICSELVAI